MDLWTKDEFEERLIASLLMITSGTYCGISGRKGSSKENSNGMSHSRRQFPTGFISLTMKESSS
jgi:hypothetical protein